MPQYILADDLTGASDAGVQFAKRGARTVVWLDYEHPQDADGDVIVVDTNSRAESGKAAYARVAQLLTQLVLRTPRDVVKKMDSTLRGNFGAETRSLLDALPEAFAIICPAYPKNERTSRDGVLFVRGTRVDETDFGRDLFSPVRDARIASHVGEPSIVFDLATIRGGVERLSGAIDAARGQGIRVAVADAETDADLRALTCLDERRADIIWVGSAGLIEMLGCSPTRRREQAGRVPGPVLFLIGSLSAMTHRQIRDFARHAVVEEIDPSDLLRDAPAVGVAVARASTALEGGNHALLAVDGARAAVAAALALSNEYGWTVHEAGRRLRRALVATISPLVLNRPRGTFVLSGGDVARTFCESFGVRGMRLLAEIAPGIPLSHAIGADMFLVTKAGGFGNPETYWEILAALKEKVTQ